MGNLITQIEKGSNVEARTRTLVTGLIRGAQEASKRGDMADWSRETTGNLDNYATAVAGTGGQAAGVGAGATTKG